MSFIEFIEEKHWEDTTTRFVRLNGNKRNTHYNGGSTECRIDHKNIDGKLFKLRNRWPSHWIEIWKFHQNTKKKKPTKTNKKNRTQPIEGYENRTPRFIPTTIHCKQKHWNRLELWDEALNWTIKHREPLDSSQKLTENRIKIPKEEDHRRRKTKKKHNTCGTAATDDTLIFFHFNSWNSKVCYFFHSTDKRIAP